MAQKFPEPAPQRDGDELVPSERQQELLNTLTSYKEEAQEARESGENPRDAKWSNNWNLYWNRYDFSDKADWQSQRTMPEVPAFVDRFAAAVKEAAAASHETFYAITDPTDGEGDLTDAVKRVTDYFLTQAGVASNGRPLPFLSVMEDQAKMGAISACCASVTWKTDIPGGRVSVETVDPRFVWLDPTGRNLYRVRQFEIDRHELHKMMGKRDRKKNPIFDEDEIVRLQNDLSLDMRQARREASGHGHELTSKRQTVTLDEYIATVVDENGEIIAEDELIVVANDKYVIRGPEKNPFWHGQDWVVFSPLITTPLSVYGRSYMEDFGSVAETFTALTNMILDAVYISSMNAIALVPDALENPSDIETGLWPMKIFQLEDGQDPKRFASAIELGSFDPSAVQVWTAMKSELSEAAGVNEVGLGQFAPNSRTSATEIAAAQQSSSALVRSVVQTLELHVLDPILDLVWKTGMQHVSPNDEQVRRVLGEEMHGALMPRRKELIQRGFTFQSRGISGLIQKSQKLQGLIQTLQMVAQNEALAQAFVQAVDFDKLMRLIMQLSNVDLHDIKKSERQRMVEGVVQQLQARAAGGQPNTAQENAGAAMAAGLGVQQEQ